MLDSVSPEEMLDRTKKLGEAVVLDDFRALMTSHTYIFMPTGETWAGASVNARVPPVPIGDKTVSATAWLDRNRPIEQMTWSPGEPQLIGDRLIVDGAGWIDRPGACVLNLYRPPTIRLGDPNKAGVWVDHVRKVYPDDAGHIINFLAQRVQRPADKINHALLLGGNPGIGKDTLLEPVKRAVGPWNFQDVKPQHMLSRFNGFLKSTILRVSEVHDLGEFNQFSFYEHLKTYTAAPPDTIRIDEKHLREYYIPNCCGVIFTTNHKSDGIFLPPDDRRTYVAWSDSSEKDFPADYWARMWRFLNDDDGDRHVAAYLAMLDLSAFNPKAPPLKTPAFWNIVAANSAPEDTDLAEAIDDIDSPDALTVDMLARDANAEFGAWLRDVRNHRQIPHRLEKCGYVSVQNDPVRTDCMSLAAGGR